MTSTTKVNLFLSEFPKLSNLEIQQKYLNCCEWTESIISALSQLEDELQILRIIKLALEVDLVLGAKLISEIKEDFQKRAIALIVNLNLTKTLTINLLIKTKSKYTILHLEKILDKLIFKNSEDFYRRYKISEILAFIKKIDPEFVLKYFIKILEFDYENSPNFDLEAFNNLNYESLGFIFSKSEIKNHQLCNQIKKLLKQKLINNDFKERPDRGLAIKYLATLEDDWAINELKNDYYRKDYFYLNKWEIIDVFSQVEDRTVIPYLIYGLFESCRNCRYSAITGLAKRKDINEDLKIDILIHGLCQEIDDEIYNSIKNTSIGEALSEISPDKAIEKLSLMLKCDDVKIRINAIDALRYIHHKSVLDISIKALQDSSEEVVIEALRNLFAYPQINNTETDIVLSIDSLDNCLYSNNSKIFESTLELIEPSSYGFNSNLILQIKKSQPIHNLLLERLQEDNEQIKIEAIYKLGCFNLPEAKQQLRQSIEDNNPKIQAYAAYALGKIGDNLDIPLLIEKLKHPEAIVREGTANGLRLMRSELAKQPLIEALIDENVYVTRSIIEALGTIGGEDIEEYLIQLARNTNDFAILDRTIVTLGTFGEEKTVQLLKSLVDKSLQAKKREDYDILLDIETVIWALERIENASAIELLLDLAQYGGYPYSQSHLSLTRVGKLETIPGLWEIQHKSKHSYLLETISYIQKCYGYYNPDYCEISPQNLKKNITHNNYKNHLKYDYSYSRIRAIII